MKLKTAFILAGGKGTRLGRIGEEIPKSLLPLNGKPILERIISWLRKNGVENVILGVGYRKEQIKDYFGDGNKFGVNISYVEHDPNGGTEDAFKTDIENVKLYDENFYAMNGDQITDLQLDGLTNAHIKNDAIVTMVTIKLRTNFGVIETDHSNKIIHIQEKWTIPNVLMNTGIYVFNKKIKDYLLEGNIEENTFRKLSEEGKIYSFYYDGEWFSVNDQKEFERVENYLKKFEALNGEL